jgi:glycerol-3-phosphate acyltransferase PlsY
MITLLSALAAYLLGSVSFAIIASRLFGLPDPRSYGSGNPGATNVLRSGKRAAALVTLAGDVGKGLAAVLVAGYLSAQSGAGEAPAAAAGLTVFLGHLYPLYFRFQGGKGVATASGVLFGFSPVLAVLALMAFVVVAVVSRYVSLASVVAAVTAIVAAPLLLGWGATAGAALLVSLLVIWRHRGNLQRLFAGTERRLSFGSRDAPPAGGA